MRLNSYVLFCQTRPDGVPLAYSFLHELNNLRLCGGGQLLQRKAGRPHVAVVEVRIVLKAESCIPRVELTRSLEEANDLAIRVGIRRYPRPGLRHR